MAETYQKQADSAARLIKKAGMPVTFSAAGGSVPKYDEDGNLVTSTDTATGHGVFLRYKSNLALGTSIQTGDQYVLYSGAKPDNGMTTTQGGRDWVVVTSEPLTPTTVNILYKVQVR